VSGEPSVVRLPDIGGLVNGAVTGFG
jgi:hypothetical protein